MNNIEILAKRYEPIIAQLPTISGLKSVDSKCIMMSDVAAQLIGYKNGRSCIGISDYDTDCNASHLAETFIQEDQEALKYGQSKQLYFSKYANGEIKVFYCIKSRFLDLDGTVIGVFADCQDVTHFQEMQHRVLAAIFASDYPITSARFELKSHYDSITLTRRESEVFFYIIRQKSIKFIAKKLARSPRTIEKHLEHIMHKLGCNTSNQLREFAEEKNLTKILLEKYYTCPSKLNRSLDLF